jgi:hypothetical protein
MKSSYVLLTDRAQKSVRYIDVQNVPKDVHNIPSLSKKTRPWD